MTHLSKRPKALLTTLQLLTVLIGVFGIWLAGVMGLLGISLLSLTIRDMGAAANGTIGVMIFTVCALATVAVVSVCCCVTLGSFFMLLQRMKKETAFTRRNCGALGRMALCCLLAAAALFPMMGYVGVGVVLPLESFTGGLVRLVGVTEVLMAWPFGFLVVSLLLQGVRVLMVRAMTLQEAQEYVV